MRRTGALRKIARRQKIRAKNVELFVLKMLLLFCYIHTGAAIFHFMIFKIIRSISTVSIPFAMALFRKYNSPRMSSRLSAVFSVR